MALTQKNTGDAIAASDHNEIYSLLKTTTAKEWVTFTHKGADIASAGTLQLGGDGNYFDVTGTTGITAISSLQAGTMIVLEFDGAVAITHNATTLSLLGGANYTTAAGDRLLFISEGSGNWREISRGMFVGGGYVTLTGSETLSNKTIAGATFTGNLIFTDSTYDIGAATATRPRDLWLAGKVSTLGVVSVGSQLTIASQNIVTEFNYGNSGTVASINWNNGDTQRVAMNGNCTFNFANQVGGRSYTLVLTQDGTGSRTAAWPSDVKWAGGTAPTLTTTATTGRDVLTFAYFNGISIYVGVSVLDVR